MHFADFGITCSLRITDQQWYEPCQNSNGKFYSYACLQVVSAVQKAFQYSPEGDSNDVLFNRLLSPVTAQLSAELPESIREREVDEASLQIVSGSTQDELDVMGRAVVGALVQMGASSGSETLLRPLHHQVWRYCSAAWRILSH